MCVQQQYFLTEWFYLYLIHLVQTSVVIVTYILLSFPSQRNYVNVCESATQVPSFIVYYSVIPTLYVCPGVIPSWVNGRLMRNGPGIFEVGDTRYHHWFDGLALVHSFTILNGKLLCFSCCQPIFCMYMYMQLCTFLCVYIVQ